jgi:hypothetical protein
MKEIKYKHIPIVAVISLSLFFACTPIRSVSFNETLRQDTVMYSGNANYLGPFYIKVGEPTIEHRMQAKLFSSKEETQDIFSFSICSKEFDCVEADSYFYKKIANTGLLGTKDGGITRVKSQKIYGSIYYNKQEAMSFTVDVGGKGPGKGFLTLPENGIITIEPINKKSTYGKTAYGVGLEFKRNGQTIGGFKQIGELIEVVLKKGETEKMKLILSALAVALVNRSNEIRIL